MAVKSVHAFSERDFGSFIANSDHRGETGIVSRISKAIMEKTLN